MALNGRGGIAAVGLLQCLIAWAVLKSTSQGVNATPNDIYCLKAVQSSLSDPQGFLSTWNFENEIEGNICQFIGVECWHPNENRVLNLRLFNMGLSGKFPRGIENCSSITGLDLSRNNLTGQIPKDISQKLRYITSLDLSFNKFSGEIPVSLSKCSYLNDLNLEHNRLTGRIPVEIGLLNRIKTFNVADNLLYGQVPEFNDAKIPRGNYGNNPGLCGEPLEDCLGPRKKSPTGIIAWAAAAGVTLMAVVVALLLYYMSRRIVARNKQEALEGNRWAKNIKGGKAIKVSMFDISARKMTLNELLKATDSFSKSNIIGSGRTGIMYRATLDDGTFLTVKRLSDSQRSEKEFLSEMNTLGSVKHKNLVPLLGFCMTNKERLLVYEHMTLGTLYDHLHPKETVIEIETKPNPEVENSKNDNNEGLMDWSLRLRIGMRAARGLAWLHHNCNPRIIHRNISSKCILLDKNFEPKLSDFGLARLMNPIDTHLSTFVNGEFGDLGYVAPEYLRTLVATPNGDVYSFGIVLLELITGEKPTHIAKAPEGFKGSLAEWVVYLSDYSLLETAIDKSLLDKGYHEELMQVLRLACNCVSINPKERPTMFEVYQLLRAIGESHHFPTDDEIWVPSESTDANMPDELIVAAI